MQPPVLLQASTQVFWAVSTFVNNLHPTPSFFQLCFKPSHHAAALLTCWLPRLTLQVTAAEVRLPWLPAAIQAARAGSWRTPSLGYLWPSYLHVTAAQEHLPWLPAAPKPRCPEAGFGGARPPRGADPRSLGTHGGRGESPLAGSSFSINRARMTSLVWGSQRLDVRVRADESYLSSLSHGSSPAFHLRLPGYGSLCTSRT